MKELATIGDHLKHQRLLRRLSKAAVAREMGTNTNTIRRWEANGSIPTLRTMPKMIAFLGFDPLPPPENPSEADLVRLLRRRLGMRQTELASLLGVSPWTVQDWESGKVHPASDHLERIRLFLEEGS